MSDPRVIMSEWFFEWVSEWVSEWVTVHECNECNDGLMHEWVSAMSAVSACTSDRSSTVSDSSAIAWVPRECMSAIE